MLVINSTRRPVRPVAISSIAPAGRFLISEKSQIRLILQQCMPVSMRHGQFSWSPSGMPSSHGSDEKGHCGSCCLGIRIHLGSGPPSLNCRPILVPGEIAVAFSSVTLWIWFHYRHFLAWTWRGALQRESLASHCPPWQVNSSIMSVADQRVFWFLQADADFPLPENWPLELSQTWKGVDALVTMESHVHTLMRKHQADLVSIVHGYADLTSWNKAKWRPEYSAQPLQPCADVTCFWISCLVNQSADIEFDGENHLPKKFLWSDMWLGATKTTLTGASDRLAGTQTGTNLDLLDLLFGVKWVDTFMEAAEICLFQQTCSACHQSILLIESHSTYRISSESRGWAVRTEQKGT